MPKLLRMNVPERQLCRVINKMTIRSFHGCLTLLGEIDGQKSSQQQIHKEMDNVGELFPCFYSWVSTIFNG